MKKKLIYTKKNSEELLGLESKNLEKAIQNKYDFEIGYIPEGYNIAFLLIKDDKEDSRKDIWKVVFFKETRKLNGTITLDNAEELSENNEKKFEFFKEFEVNFEDVINISTDIIKKYRGDRKKVESKIS